MSRNLQDFVDEPPFGLIIAGALGLIITIFAFVGLRNIRGGDDNDATAGAASTSITDPATIPAAPSIFIFTPATSDGVECDGSTQTVGVISGAEPGETLLFNSNSGVNVPEGFTDSSGSYPLEWNCTASEVGTTWRLQAVGQNTGGRVDIVFAGAANTNASEFQATSITDPFPCDGEVHRLATLVGATSNEEISFSSPQSSSIRSGTADENGELRMNWSCNPSQADETWNVTATGATSNQVVAINFSGSRVPESRNQSTTTSIDETTTVSSVPITASTPETASSSSTVSSAELVVQVNEDPFECNGVSRQFAKIQNFTALETIDFAVVPSGGPVRQGTADDKGELLVRWQCDAEDAGTEWNLMATGATSEKTVSFSFAGAAPGSSSSSSTTGGDNTSSGSGTSDDGSLDTQLSVAVIENPFICDGETRPVVTLSNLGAQEVVTFSSADGASYLDGEAGANGTLSIRWQCEPDEVQTWNITATGQTTGKTVEFSILGSAPSTTN